MSIYDGVPVEPLSEEDYTDIRSSSPLLIHNWLMLYKQFIDRAQWVYRVVYEANGGYISSRWQWVEGDRIIRFGYEELNTNKADKELQNGYIIYTDNVDGEWEHERYPIRYLFITDDAIREHIEELKAIKIEKYRKEYEESRLKTYLALKAEFEGIY